MSAETSTRGTSTVTVSFGRETSATASLPASLARLSTAASAGGGGVPASELASSGVLVSEAASRAPPAPDCPPALAPPAPPLPPAEPPGLAGSSLHPVAAIESRAASGRRRRMERSLCMSSTAAEHTLAIFRVLPSRAQMSLGFTPELSSFARRVKRSARKGGEAGEFQCDECGSRASIGPEEHGHSRRQPVRVHAYRHSIPSRRLSTTIAARRRRDATASCAPPRSPESSPGGARGIS